MVRHTQRVFAVPFYSQLFVAPVNGLTHVKTPKLSTDCHQSLQYTLKYRKEMKIIGHEFLLNIVQTHLPQLLSVLSTMRKK